MSTINNFSVDAGDSVNLNWTVDPKGTGVTLGPGTQIFWSVFTQSVGIPDFESGPVIVKVLDHGIQITNPDLLQFTVEIDRTDTIGLLRNYYHECLVVDASGNYDTVTKGIMTVLGTEIR